DGGGFDELELLATRHQQSLAGARLRTRGAYGVAKLRRAAAFAQTLQGFLEPVAVVGLQKIVDRVQVERTDGVLVEGRHEHQQWRRVAFELCGDFETGEAGHLDVEKYHVGLQRLDGRGRGETVRRLAGNLEVALRADPAAQLVARRGFVVDDEHAHHHNGS